MGMLNGWTLNREKKKNDGEKKSEPCCRIHVTILFAPWVTALIDQGRGYRIGHMSGD
jgi:hypothetical protein